VEIYRISYGALRDPFNKESTLLAQNEQFSDASCVTQR